MKKWKITLGILAALTLSTGYGSVSAQENSQIQFNYKDTGISSKQVIAENTTFVPLKSLTDAMGYTLSWDQQSKKAKLVRPEREVAIIVGSKNSKVNGSIIGLSKQPRMIKGSVYVPLVSAVNVLGGKIGVDKEGNIQIADKPRFVTATAQGRTYWVSQLNGDLYYRDSVAGQPVRICQLPLTGSAYNHGFEIKSFDNGTDMLQLIDNHYAMFTDFSNSYQVLVKAGTILKQMDYHFVTAAYPHASQVQSTQLFMTDGKNVQYISKDGRLGKLLELEKLTGTSGDFTVEYAVADVTLVRSLNTTQLFAINSSTDEVTNLSERLISTEDRKDWDKVTDSRDPYVLSKMLVLKNRDGNVLTFNYTPLIDGYAKKVTYTLVTK
ncbi:copper amine oxidase N-terminal domain-containing protein [Paenibacillus sp.]|uniref:copper amine oxidase N-terminal domain-containing protein n=1 Tax=Paenibacillus sp. TaxID=58172 RepID=UPI0028AEA46A|nr:copper amine oxidase N-terminal domain-containing protein [Paenibacillus sp.]